MYGQQPRIQQVCSLLTFGADVCAPHSSIKLRSGVRVQAPMSLDGPASGMGWARLVTDKFRALTSS